METIILLILLALIVAGLIFNAVASHGWQRDHKSQSSSAEKEYYRLNIFYYNPDDNRIFVPKRYGGGYTINFGKPVAVLIMILLIALILTIFL